MGERDPIVPGVRVARELYAAFNSGNVEWLLSHLHPDVAYRWEAAGQGAVEATGRDAARETVEMVAREFSGYSLDPRAISDYSSSGRTIVVNGRFTAALRDGSTVEGPFSQRLELDADGKIVEARFLGSATPHSLLRGRETG